MFSISGIPAVDTKYLKFTTINLLHIIENQIYQSQLNTLKTIILKCLDICSLYVFDTVVQL